MTAAVEERLREALAARAGQITAADLQPAAAPSLLSGDRAGPGWGGLRPGDRAGRARLGLSWGGRGAHAGRGLRPGGRGLGRPFSGGRWAPVLAGVAVAAVAAVFAVLLAWHPGQSSPPGRAPYLPGDAPASVPASSRPGPVSAPPQPRRSTSLPAAPATGPPPATPSPATPSPTNPSPTASTAPWTTAPTNAAPFTRNVVPR
jgi:hypothetical protein